MPVEQTARHGLMAAAIPTQARVVIVGGGIIGCSIAYHLAKMGWQDVVLLERKKLTGGTTWHAAGLVGQLRPSQNMTKLAKYTAELYITTSSSTCFTRSRISACPTRFVFSSSSGVSPSLRTL